MCYIVFISHSLHWRHIKIALRKYVITADTSKRFLDAGYCKVVPVWLITLLSLVQITSNLVQKHAEWYYTPYQNLGQIDRNLHYHVFDDVISKRQ